MVFWMWLPPSFSVRTAGIRAAQQVFMTIQYNWCQSVCQSGIWKHFPHMWKKQKGVLLCFLMFFQEKQFCAGILTRVLTCYQRKADDFFCLVHLRAYKQWDRLWVSTTWDNFAITFKTFKNFFSFVSQKNQHSTRKYLITEYLLSMYSVLFKHLRAYCHKLKDIPGHVIRTWLYASTLDTDPCIKNRCKKPAALYSP